MFDIGYGELLVIGIAALIFIGPKELPGVLRALGQWTSKIRRMAGEFQNQFHEAMREAEMADLKKEVDDIATQAANYSNFDPLAEVRKDMDDAKRDIEASLGGNQLADASAAREPGAPTPISPDTAIAETVPPDELPATDELPAADAAQPDQVPVKEPLKQGAGGSEPA